MSQSPKKNPVSTVITASKLTIKRRISHEILVIFFENFFPVFVLKKLQKFRKKLQKKLSKFCFWFWFLFFFQPFSVKKTSPDLPIILWLSSITNFERFCLDLFTTPHTEYKTILKRNMEKNWGFLRIRSDDSLILALQPAILVLIF